MKPEATEPNTTVAAETGISYLLPLRWGEAGPIEELADYLQSVRGWVDEVLVIDGSSEPVFEQHHEWLRGVVRHIRPAPDLDFHMGKVNGVITGVRECRYERVVIADDDVRYDESNLHAVAGLLSRADLVRPQNYFDELPWHAVWDSGRSLLNRVFTGDFEFPVGDFPGTLAVRRSTFLRANAYDGDVIFENLELMRTIKAAGGSILTPLDLYVARRPPTTAHFFSQRVRQAYDDFSMPLRSTFFLSLPILLAASLGRRRWGRLSAIFLATIGVAEWGRRRAGGARLFPLASSLLAPAWLCERAICSWLALAARLRGGVRYGEGRIKNAATPLSRLQDRSPTKTMSID